MGAQVWTFAAMDTLFFRDGQPMNMGESAWIDSRFPPTGITLQGAIRAAVLDHLKADIPAFQQGKPCLPGGCSLKESIGDAEGIGNLRLTGPVLRYQGQPWFPAPLDLVTTDSGHYELMRPAEKATRCDLGRIRLPWVESLKGRYKTLVGRYLPQSALLRLLRGDARLESDESLPIIAVDADKPGLTDREPKIGLARDNRYRTHLQGRLYAIALIRPRPQVDLQIMVESLETEWVPTSPFPCHLGGEKRLARVSVEEGGFSWSSVPLHEQGDRLRFKILFLTPALFPKPGWLPGGFETYEQKGFDCCRGQVGDAVFDIISAAVGKPERIGGWNLNRTGSRALQSYLPAGSVLFCESDPQQREAIERLHATKIGSMTEYGFGHILIGRW